MSIALLQSYQKININCTYSLIDYKGLLYQAGVTGAQIAHEGSVIQSVRGSHIEGKSDEDVQVIAFFNTSFLNFFPKGLGKIFPNLVVLRMTGCGLTKITAEDLDGLENLTVLGIPHNQLSTIPSNLLKNMKRLEEFYCHGNPLQYLSSKLLTYENANSLKGVTFKDCNCINLQFPGDCSTLNELKDAIASTCEPPEIEVKKFTKNLKVVEKFWHLWTSGNFSDFTIESGIKKFKVHKSVLGIQSSVLGKAVQSDMEEGKSGRMKIVDFSSDAVEEFLQYFYSGEIGKVNAMEVFALAAKYDVPELKSIVERIVAVNVDEENALDVLTFGNLHDSEIIMKAAFEVIKTILSDITLPDHMFKSPGDLLDLLNAKRKYETYMEAAKKTYQNVVDEKIRKN